MSVWLTAAIAAALAVAVAVKLLVTNAATDGSSTAILPSGRRTRAISAAAVRVAATGWLALAAEDKPVVVIALAAQLPLWIALAAVDLRTFRLPAGWTRALWFIAPVTVVAACLLDRDLPVMRLAVGAGAWGGLIGGLWLLTKGRGMGLGDVRLAPSLGLVCGWFGWGSVGFGLLAAFATGAVFGVACRLAGRRGRVPFGPFLIVGAAVGIAAGQWLGGAYLSVLGLT